MELPGRLGILACRQSIAVKSIDRPGRLPFGPSCELCKQGPIWVLAFFPPYEQGRNDLGDAGRPPLEVREQQC